MKDWWPFLVASAIAIALFSFWIGAVSVTGVSLHQAPHGIMEYWTDRYQTVIAAFIAVSGAMMVVRQIAETRAQHKANIRLALRNEFDALQSAMRFADYIIRVVDDPSSDVATALMNLPTTRHFTVIDPKRLGRIEQWTGDVVNAFFKIMLEEIASYEAWRNAGSKVENDIFGIQGETFEVRIGRVREAAVDVTEVTEYRRRELEGLTA